MARAEILSGNRNCAVRQGGLFDLSIRLPKKLAPNSVLIKKLRQILLIHFSNGFRIDYPIELGRFRRFALKDYNMV